MATGSLPLQATARHVGAVASKTLESHATQPPLCLPQQVLQRQAQVHSRLGQGHEKAAWCVQRGRVRGGARAVRRPVLRSGAVLQLGRAQVLCAG